MGYKPNNKWRASVRNADSKWEGELGEGILEDWEHHPEKIPYTIDHTYTPDFGKGNLIIEAKGRFMDNAEARKYVWIRESLPNGKELLFLFYNHKTPLPHARVRKDGTKLTHGEWATKNKFRWYTENTITQVIGDK